MAEIVKIKMKKSMPVALDGIQTIYVKIGDVVAVQDYTGTGLVEQGFAEYYTNEPKSKMVRSTVSEAEPEIEEKDEGHAPENKDESPAPKNKKKPEGFIEEDLRVWELARQQGVEPATILIKAVELGFGKITKAANKLTREQAVKIIQSMDTD